MSDSERRAGARRAAPDTADAAAQAAAETGAPSQDEMTVAFTPKQLFTGFAILAGLIVLARRRGRRGGDDARRGRNVPGCDARGDSGRDSGER